MNWLDMTLEEVTILLADMGQQSYRAQQVYSQLHKGAGFDEMLNLPKVLREQLAERPLGGASVLKKITSRRGDTSKYLFLLQDGNIIEGVLMRHNYGNTLCISTQVGCRMGCSFCASTLEGLVRNLEPGEMLGQVLTIEREEGQRGAKSRAVTNIVLMGSGEPLDNYENVIRFLRLVTGKEGLNVSPRNISLSTCGLIEGIRALAQESLPVTLSISLHAPFDDMRRQLMPIAKKYSLASVMEAAGYYVQKTGRRVIFEYALVRDLNDTPQCAKQLQTLLRGLQCHVNLIPLNDVEEHALRGSGRAGDFLEELTALGVSASVRREMGQDIAGACGQLRQHHIQAMRPLGQEAACGAPMEEQD